MRVSYSAASPASHTANGLWKLSSKEKHLARIWPLQPVPAHSRTLPRSNTTPRRSTWPKAYLHQAWTSSRRPERCGIPILGDSTDVTDPGTTEKGRHYEIGQILHLKPEISKFRIGLST